MKTQSIRRKGLAAALGFATLAAGLPSSASGAIAVDSDTVLYVTCDTDYGFGINSATAADMFTSTFRYNDILQTEGMVAEAVRDGADGTDVANGGYLYSASGIAVEWQGASGYCSGDFTFECFVRIDADATSSDLSGNYIVYHPGAWMIQFNSGLLPILKNSSWGELGKPPSSLADGVWHHLAVVQDRTRGTFRYYIDYRLVSEADYVVTPPENSANYNYFRINNYARNGQYNFTLVTKKIAYDEVRLVKRALAPKDFITTATFAEDLKARERKLAAMTPEGTLVYAAFDGALTTNNVNELRGETGKPALTLKTSGVLGGTDGLASVYPAGFFDAEAQGNAGSLAFADTGFMTVDDTSYLDDDFTLEFFLKCDDASQLYKSTADKDGYLVHQNKLFYMRMQGEGNNLGSVSCNETYVSGLADGAWHHYAIVYDKSALTVRYYVDHRFVASTTYEKELSELKTSDPLYLGAGSWSNGAWHRVKGVAYDEIRLIAKALKPAAFLSARRWPVFEETTAYLSFDDGVSVAAARPALDPSVSVTCAQAATFEKTAESIQETLYATARSDEATANAGALHMDIGKNDNSQAGGGYVFDDPDYDYSTGSFTVETFFKADGSTTYYGYLFKVWESWSVYLTNGGNNRLGCSVGGSDVIGTESLADGKWHHLAVVCDETTKTLSFWLDHTLFHRFENVENPLKDGATRSTTLLYGCYQKMAYGVGGSPKECWFDELRLTKRALKVTEFLTAEPLAGDAVLANVRFESGWDAEAGQGVYTLRGAASDAGVQTVRSSRASHGIADAKGVELYEDKRGAEFTGGTVVYEGNGLLDAPCATVEAFVRRTAGTASDSVLTLAKNGAADSPIWRLNADGSFAVAGAAEAFPSVNMADGEWHHLAVSHETTADGVAVTLYWDYAAVATRTVAGAFDFGLGAGLVCGSAGFGGSIDEIRVSPTALTVDEFLYALPRRGFTIRVR